MILPRFLPWLTSVLGLLLLSGGMIAAAQAPTTLKKIKAANQESIEELDAGLALACPARGQGWTAASALIGADPPTSSAKLRNVFDDEEWAFMQKERKTSSDELVNALADYHSLQSARAFARHAAWLVDAAARDKTPLASTWMQSGSSHPYFVFDNMSNTYSPGWDTVYYAHEWSDDVAGYPYFSAWRTKASDCVRGLRRDLFEATAGDFVAQATASGKSLTVRSMLTTSDFRSVADSSPVLRPVLAELIALEKQFAASEIAAAEDKARREEQQRQADALALVAAQRAAAEAEAQRLRDRVKNDTVWRAAWSKGHASDRNFICDGYRYSANEIGTAMLGAFGLPDNSPGVPFSFQARFNADFSTMEARLTSNTGIGSGRHPVTFVGPGKVEYIITYLVDQGGGRKASYAGTGVIDLESGDLDGLINWQNPMVGTRLTDTWAGYCSLN